MALTNDQLVNIRNGIEEDSGRRFAIDYIKSELATSLQALDSEFETITKTVFNTRLGASLSAAQKNLAIKYWLTVKGRDF